MMKKLAALILIILAIAMIYLSVTMGVIPPGVTGIGFIIIAIVFLRE